MKKAPQKILAGIGVVTLLGSAALGFLIFKKSGEAAAARSAFETTAATYQGLRSRPLFPSAENLKKLEEQRDAAATAAETALQELSPLAFRVEEVTPEQFQDQLRQTVNRVVAKAEERNVALPEDFYLGFDRYRNQAPTNVAAPFLLRQLKTMELAAGILIDSHVDAITSFTRTELPEEGGKAAPQQLVSRFPFNLGFRATQASFRRVLNEVTATKEQYFIPRNLVVKNEGDKQLPKVSPAAAAAAAQAGAGVAPGATAEPAAAENKTALQYLVGNERLDVSLNLEMVVFAESFTSTTTR